MRRLLTLATLTGLMAAAACQDHDPFAGPLPAADVVPAAAAPQAQDRVLPGELLVRVRPGEDEAAVAAAYGVAVSRHGLDNAFAVMRGAAGNEIALAARMRGDSRVEWAEPNWLRQADDVDPALLWAFRNPGGLTISFTSGRNRGQVVTSEISKADADIDDEGTFASNGSSVIIGSIDTGVDFSHVEFNAGQLIVGNDWYDNDSDPSDTQGHGTHTTGTMVGRTVGVSGNAGAVANVRAYVQRVCGAIGCPSDAIANAIHAAADYPGMVAMNLSLGGSVESNAEKSAIAYATSKNVLVIASAGNNGSSTVSCPACDPAAISVAALNWKDELTYYSNYGSGLDISAPGGEMYSNTSEEGGILSSVPGGYAYYQGTSMAAPMVTGVAGITASVTGLRGVDLRNRIESTADNLGSATTFGHGRVNALAAVTNGSGGGGGGVTLTASFTSSCQQLTCNFDASASTGATGWNWLFGDDATGSGETTSHTFPNVAGNYTVTLTVDDGNNNTASTTGTIRCLKRGKNIRCS